MYKKIYRKNVDNAWIHRWSESFNNELDLHANYCTLYGHNIIYAVTCIAICRTAVHAFIIVFQMQFHLFCLLLALSYIAVSYFTLIITNDICTGMIKEMFTSHVPANKASMAHICVFLLKAMHALTFN